MSCLDPPSLLIGVSLRVSACAKTGKIIIVMTYFDFLPVAKIRFFLLFHQFISFLCFYLRFFTLFFEDFYSIAVISKKACGTQTFHTLVHLVSYPLNRYRYSSVASKQGQCLCTPGRSQCPTTCAWGKSWCSLSSKIFNSLFCAGVRVSAGNPSGFNPPS